MKRSKAFSKARIGVLGSGRVATALLKGLSEIPSSELHLIARDPSQREALGERFAVDERVPVEDCDPGLDLLLIAVSDDAIQEVVRQLPGMKGVVAHCSGVKPLSELDEQGRGQGVFYPLQSFSGDAFPDWSSIPICIEGSDQHSQEELRALAGELSDTVRELGEDERKQLHVAAVFACNFSNHLYAIARKLLQEKGIDYELLRSLILHTARKGVEQDPTEAQTGPASRGDRETMQEHLALLEGNPDLYELYSLLSQRIMKEAHGTSEL